MSKSISIMLLAIALGVAAWLLPLLFEAWDNVAAFDAFAIDLFKKYQAKVGNMIAKRDIRSYSSVAMNFKEN